MTEKYKTHIITRTRYECKVCKYTTDDLEFIKKHAKIPENKLPNGLVINDKEDIFERGWPTIILEGPFPYISRESHEHTYDEYFRHHDTTSRRSLIASYVKDSLKTGEIKLYSVEEFKKIEKKAKIILDLSGRRNICLVRSTPELEELIKRK